ncbi:hypothetical protein Tco_0799996 [Tanacetum coccineum]|uniref:Zinc finger, CCHC-type n=1 Tax=Tanacetum coccineum TaxID=301880 RepID=A0ABQ4ZRW9_9ASTR
MLMTMEPEIQQNLENLHAKRCVQIEKLRIAQQAEQGASSDSAENFTLANKEVAVLKLYSHFDLTAQEVDIFSANYNMHNMWKTINELHAMLKLHEQTLPKNNAPALHVIRAGKVQKGNNKHKKLQPELAATGQNQGKGKNKLAYAPKPKIPHPPKRENPAKDSICHECGETGH